MLGAEAVDSLAPDGLLFIASGYALGCLLWRPVFACSTLMDLRWCQAGGRAQHHRQPSFARLSSSLPVVCGSRPQNGRDIASTPCLRPGWNDGVAELCNELSMESSSCRQLACLCRPRLAGPREVCVQPKRKNPPACWVRQQKLSVL